MREQEFSLQRTNTYTGTMSHTARDWVVPLARFGYAVKGAVYIMIGLLAALAASNRGGRTTDWQGAFIISAYGQLLLVAVAVRLAGYAFWCFIQAIKATENKGSKAKGMVIRFGYGVVRLMHMSLAMTGVQLDLGSYASDRGEESSKEWTAILLAQPFGQ